jgi:hypothetical protein
MTEEKRMRELTAQLQGMEEIKLTNKLRQSIDDLEKHVLEIVGTQFYDSETDCYFETTRVQLTDGLYCLCGIPITIPELVEE